MPFKILHPGSACAIAVLAMALSSARAPAAAGPDGGGLPRYDLPVGRVLTYSLVTTTDRAGVADEPQPRGTLRAIVVAANADGSRRVILRSAHTLGDEPEEVAVGAVDLFPDGRARPVGRANPNAGVVDVTTVFPPLPPDDAAAATGEWRSEPNWQGGVTTYTAASVEPAPASAPADPKAAAAAAATGSGVASDTGGDALAFAGTSDGPIYRVYQLTSKSTVRFDRRKGVVVAAEYLFARGRGDKQTDTQKQTLDTDERIDPVRAAALGAAYEKLLRAVDAYHEAMGRVTQAPPDDAARVADDAKAVLTSAMKDVGDEPEVVKEFERKLAKHEENAPHDVEEAKRVATLLGKSIADWQATDLDGKAWSRDGLKGKVVVMDFWFRGCGWCVYAMPQVKQLAADYKDKPVVVLGMNVDRKEEDARHVVKALGLDYPQVKAGDLKERFNVTGFPTLIVIDAGGVVRAVHYGYSPDLREKISRRVDELLAE